MQCLAAFVLAGFTFITVDYAMSCAMLSASRVFRA